MDSYIFYSWNLNFVIPFTSANKIDSRNITDLLLKVVLITCNFTEPYLILKYIKISYSSIMLILVAFWDIFIPRSTRVGGI